jgi:hypothetical protein
MALAGLQPTRGIVRAIRLAAKIRNKRRSAPGERGAAAECRTPVLFKINRVP